MGTAAPWNSMGLKRGHGPGLGHKALGWAIPNVNHGHGHKIADLVYVNTMDLDSAINPWAGHGRGNNDS
jgi:hypothetical protein